MKLMQLGRGSRTHIENPVWVVLFVSIVFLPNTFAQNYTQWRLPEGAKARLGKGAITGNVQYSPDGTLLAVSGSIGVWLYDADTREEIDLLTGHTAWVSCIAFSPGRTDACEWQLGQNNSIVESTYRSTQDNP